MSGKTHRGREFVKDVGAGLDNASLQAKYNLSGEKLSTYKAVAQDILTRRRADRHRHRRRIDWHQFLNDVKSGMNDDALMIKYKIVESQLRKLYGKVIIAGLASPVELGAWLQTRERPVKRPRKLFGRLVWKVIAVSLLVTVVGAGALWFTSQSITPKEAGFEEVRAEAAAGGYRFMSTDELGRRYKGDPQGITVVDTRQDWEFAAGHIQGAVSFPMEPTWWSRWQKKDGLAAVLGPDKNRFIVFY